jgi:DNA repair protein RecO (recombination protein O)
MNMEPRRATGLVLRLSPVGESDLLVDIFTAEMGRTASLAKGAKRSQKRFFGILLAANSLSLNLAPLKKGSDLWRLEAASLHRSHPGLARDYRRWLGTGPILELLLRATAVQDPHPQALDLALMTLVRLEQAKELREIMSTVMIFLVRLLTILGYGLNLSSCISCGRPALELDTARLSLAGGLTCGQCQQGRFEVEVSPGLIKGLEAAATLDLAALGRLSFSQASLKPGLAFLHRFWQETAGHDLPSLGLLKRLLP